MGRTFFHVLAGNGSADITLHELMYGSYLPTDVIIQLLRTKDKMGQTPLHKSVGNSQGSEVVLVILAALENPSYESGE